MRINNCENFKGHSEGGLIDCEYCKNYKSDLELPGCSYHWWNCKNYKPKQEAKTELRFLLNEEPEKKKAKRPKVKKGFTQTSSYELEKRTRRVKRTFAVR